MKFPLFAIVLSLLFVSRVLNAEEASSDFAAYQMKMLKQEHSEEESSSQQDAEQAQAQELVCEKQKAEVAELISFAQPEKPAAVRKNAINELAALSKKSSFDGVCNSWQFDILAHFTVQKLAHNEYRNYLFSKILQHQGKLLTATIEYALSDSPIIVKEWKSIQEALLSSGHLEARQTLVALLANIETQQDLMAQLRILLKNMEGKAKAGEKTGVSAGYMLTTILSQLQKDQASEFAAFYRDFNALLDKPMRLAPYMGMYLSQDPSAERIEVVRGYITQLNQSDARMGRKDAKKLISFLDRLDQKSATNDELGTFFDQVMSENKSLISQAIRTARLKTDKKDYWLGFYQ